MSSAIFRLFGMMGRKEKKEEERGRGDVGLVY
jgi:hypothetical protein